jgi:hypothetical protein
VTRSRPTATREGSTIRYTRISADCHIDMPWMPRVTSQMIALSDWLEAIMPDADLAAIPSRR